MYAAQQEEIDMWSQQTFGYQPREGMTLEFISASDAMTFLLKWQ
jgi:hypothetical protein